MAGPTIIVGGTGGIGSTLARRLHARGTPLHLVARDATRLAELAEELGASHAAADAEDGAALAEAMRAAGPRVGGLAYAVGSIRIRPVTGLDAAAVESDFRLNALGAFLAVQAAVPALKASEASAVVLFSTVAVAQGFAGHASVSMAKGAVEGLARALAAELAPAVRVNVVAPSLTRTPLAAGLTGNERLASGIAALHAIPRLGEPEDAAALADFLLSAEAAWITGQVIGVDGGRSTLRTKG